MSQKCPHNGENRPSKEQLVDLITMKGTERARWTCQKAGRPASSRPRTLRPAARDGEGQEQKTWGEKKNRESKKPGTSEQGSRDHHLLSRPQDGEARR